MCVGRAGSRIPKPGGYQLGEDDLHVRELGANVYMLPEHGVGGYRREDYQHHSPGAAWAAEEPSWDARQSHGTPELPSSSYYGAVPAGDVDWAAALSAVRSSGGGSGVPHAAGPSQQQQQGPLDDILGQVTDLLSQVNSILGHSG